ncbi:MAG: hypothetical protein ACUVWJ_00790 [Spirochaetota bacterium]
MDKLKNPIEERVFQIDRECYIIYLGSDWLDERPFLRIGNSTRLTAKVIENIYNIIITDSITGDPILEPKNITPDEVRKSRYIGDRKTIENFKDLLSLLNVKNYSIGVFEEIKAAHDRAEAFFYDNGNIRLFYDRKMIFDLSNREKKDLHAVERLNWLKEVLGKNPLRYRQEVFQTPGFLIIDHSPVIFNRGRLLCFGLPKDYATSFVKAGVDFDLIDTLVHDELDGSAFMLLKRKGARNEQIQVLGEKASLYRSATNLLKKGKWKGLKAYVESFSQGNRKNFFDIGIEKLQEGWHIEHSSLPWPLVFSITSGKSKESIIVNTVQRTIQPPAGMDQSRLTFQKGMVYLIHEELPTLKDLLHVYLTDLIQATTCLMTDNESQLSELFEQVLYSISAPEKTQAAEARSLLEKIKQKVKKIKFSQNGIIFYLFGNADEISSILMKKEFIKKEDREGLEFSEVLDDIRRVLRKYKLKSGRPMAQFPLIADVFPSREHISILYRPVKRLPLKEDYERLVETIREIDNYDKEKSFFFEDELRRLEALIEKLSIPPSKRKEVTPEKALTEEDLIKEALSTLGTQRATSKTEASAAPAKRVAGRGKERPIAGGRLRYFSIKRGKKRAAEEELEKEGIVTVAAPERKSHTGAWIIGSVACAFIIAAALISLFLIFPEIRERRAARLRVQGEAILPEEMKAEGKILSEEAISREVAPSEGISGVPSEVPSIEATETIAGKSKAEWEEFLTEKGIPHSTLTLQRTVLYRGAIEITIMDILTLTNRIAVNNGYQTLDKRTPGRDPDWIYPGNLLVLPDEISYTVVKGDTMWYIAHRFIIQSLEMVWERYKSIEEKIKSKQITVEEKNQIAAELKKMKEESFSENFRKEVDRKLKEIASFSFTKGAN